MWDRLSEIGPLYPGVGWEIPLSLVVIGIWLGWTVWQMRHEDAEFREQVRLLRDAQSGNPEEKS